MSVMTLCRAIAATVKEEDEADDDDVVTFNFDEGSTYLGAIHILRKQNSGWVGITECL